MPHDFFFDELSKDNFLSSLLLGFRDIITISEREEMERIDEQKYDLLESTQNAVMNEEYKLKLAEVHGLESMWTRLILLWNVFSDQLQDKFSFVWTRGDDDMSAFEQAGGDFEDDLDALYG